LPSLPQNAKVKYMKIHIAADHGGFELKSQVKAYLEKKYRVQDHGAYTLEPTDDYPEFAKNLAQAIASSVNELGILICKSGIGMSIAANKIKGCYAALCFNTKHAKMAKKHNNANILCLDSIYSNKKELFRMIDVFLENEFESSEERHKRRVNQIKKLESENINPNTQT
jgi:RpiB/LacA/LacB family sugar-phosphate isomerase